MSAAAATAANPILDAALELAAHGYSVVPIRPDGTKAPVGNWRAYMHQRADEATLRAWFDHTDHDLGVVQGAISGHAELAELEGRAAHHLPALRQLAHDSGLGDVWDRLVGGWTEMSPSGGFHFHYRVTGMDVPGNVKLATRPANPDELAEKPGERIKTLAETRGEGGQVVAAPSRHHQTGQPWRRIAGGPATTPTITADERDAFHDLLRTLDEEPEPPASTGTAGLADRWQTPQREDGRLKPGDDFEARTDWATILTPHGWSLVTTQGRVRYWRRPDKGIGISASTGKAADRDRLYVFTTSTLFQAETPYTKFGAYALLNHGGDHSAAASALARQGYGEKAPQLAEVIDFAKHSSIAAAVADHHDDVAYVEFNADDQHDQAAGTAGEGENVGAELAPAPAEPQPAAPTSVQAPTPQTEVLDPIQQRIDEETARLLIQREARKRLEQHDRDAAPAAPTWIDPTELLNGTYDPPQPSVGTRLAAGLPLLYAAAVNGFVGDPESAKTLLATAIAVDELHAGGTVAWLDLDHNGAPATIARFRRFGANPAHLADPRRFRLGLPEDAAAADAIVADLVHRPATLVVLDSIGELLPLYGASSNDADEYTRVHQNVMARIATAGAAVLTIDHLSKGVDSRNYGASGTIAKKRAYDGALLRITVDQPFAPGKGGTSDVRIIKDRHGALRAAAGGGGREPLLARFILEERENQATSWGLHEPGAGGGIGEAIADVDAVADLDPPAKGYRDVKARLGWSDKRAQDAWRSYRELTSSGAL